MSTGWLWSFMAASVVSVVTVTGVFIYEYLANKKQKIKLTQDISRLDNRIALLQKELESLQKERQVRRRKRIKSTDTITSEIGSESFASATENNGSDEEFYDTNDILDYQIRSNDVLNKILFELDTQLDGNESSVDKAHKTLLDLNIEYPDTYIILWRLGKSYQKLHENTSDLEKKKMYINKGIEICSKALEIDDTDFNAHKWRAILVGCRANIQTSTKEKIIDASLFKSYLDRVLELNPDDWSSYHLLGRFKYEVANLSWWERMAASTFFADVPEATYDEAIECLKKAETVSKLCKENRLIIAKCYIGKSDYCEALNWLNQAQVVPACTKSDEAADIEIESLLKTYNSYS